MPIKNLRQQNQIVISQPLYCHVYRRQNRSFQFHGSSTEPPRAGWGEKDRHGDGLLKLPGWVAGITTVKLCSLLSPEPGSPWHDSYPRGLDQVPPPRGSVPALIVLLWHQVLESDCCPALSCSLSCCRTGPDRCGGLPHFSSGWLRSLSCSPCGLFIKHCIFSDVMHNHSL